PLGPDLGLAVAVLVAAVLHPLRRLRLRVDAPIARDGAPGLHLVCREMALGVATHESAAAFAAGLYHLALAGRRACLRHVRTSILVEVHTSGQHSGTPRALT